MESTAEDLNCQCECVASRPFPGLVCAVVSGGADSKVIFWRVSAKGATLHVSLAHRNGVQSVDFNAQGTQARFLSPSFAPHPASQGGRLISAHTRMTNGALKLQAEHRAELAGATDEGKRIDCRVQSKLLRLCGGGTQGRSERRDRARDLCCGYRR